MNVNTSSLRQSGILEECYKFKKEGKKLKEVQNVYECEIQNLLLQKSEADARFKELKSKNEIIKTQINMIKIQSNQLKEIEKQNKKLLKEFELKSVELHRKSIVAHYILDNEEAMMKEGLPILKHTSNV